FAVLVLIHAVVGSERLEVVRPGLGGREALLPRAGRIEHRGFDLGRLAQVAADARTGLAERVRQVRDGVVAKLVLEQGIELEVTEDRGTRPERPLPIGTGLAEVVIPLVP